ncbi:MAG: hypothetical protein AMJ56_11970 [Anaerolineae bacterium SG8_19]|jgi:hypothetical protein|nr:MAG: hypothetical protein AMJ56_11970 [Anaerolineae bacterium SG8_19]
MNPLRTAEDYELFLYTLVEQFPAVQRSTVTFIRRGASLARVSGELFFAQGIRLIIRERVLFHRLPGVIDWYGYEVWRNDERLYWYDPQPHPHDPELQKTHPHHKHVPPNMKNNRIPAPELNFTEPNIPWLIEEIETVLSREH